MPRVRDTSAFDLPTIRREDYGLWVRALAKDVSDAWNDGDVLAYSIACAKIGALLDKMTDLFKEDVFRQHLSQISQTTQLNALDALNNKEEV